MKKLFGTIYWEKKAQEICISSDTQAMNLSRHKTKIEPEFGISSVSSVTTTAVDGKIEKKKEQLARLKQYHSLKKNKPILRTFAYPSLLNQIIDSKHIDDLENLGWTVVENVLNEKEIDQGKEYFYQWIEGFGVGLTRDNLLQEVDNKIGHKHGIVEYPPSGFSDPAVYTRTCKNVSRVFSELYGCDPRDLITSFDRIQIGVKSQPKKRNISNSRGIPNWAHIDQDSRSRGFQCIQGSVTFNDINEDGGSLFVLEGSHKFHDELFEKMDAIDEKDHNKKNWVKLPRALDSWLIEEKQCVSKIIRPVKAGSMILWDSRLVHANVSPSDNSVRLVTYVCMLPRNWVKEAKGKQLERRRKAFLETRSTSHWPNMMMLFSDNFPFRSNLKKELKGCYNKKYTDPMERLKSAIVVLKTTILDSQEKECHQRSEEIVRQLGFHNLEDFYNSLKEFGCDIKE